VNWILPQFWFLPYCLGPCPAPLQSPLDLSPFFILLHHWPKFRPLALSDPDFPLVHQQKHLTCEPTSSTTALELLLSLGKLDHPVWDFGLSDFPILELSCPAAVRHSRNDCPLCSSLHDQNLQLVLIILGESASVAEPKVCTTLPKVDKADTSSAKPPTAQALVSRSGSRVSDDNLTDDDPRLLNFTTVAF
jgi:hypothetical protein